MKRHPQLLRALIGLVLTSVVALGLFSQEPGSAQRSAFMRLKLEPAKSILEGIALNDFGTIAQSAERLRKLTLDEDWMVRQSQEYRRQSAEFQRAVSLIGRAASERNLDGATIAYLQMTLQCVHCHKMLRDGAGTHP